MFNFLKHMFQEETTQPEVKDLETITETTLDTEGSETKTEEPLTGTIEMADYLITGLVDYTDEQGNIAGQLPQGEVLNLPVVVGDKAVEAGQAERVQ